MDCWFSVLVGCAGGSNPGPDGGSNTSTLGISGTITGATAVTVNLTGAAIASTTTDANGYYSFGSLANGSYSLTPSKADYTFSPASITVTVNSGNVAARNFTATAITYSVSGTITGATAVTVDLTGAASASTTTDANGNYSFGSLANGSYTLTPSKASYSFSPASIAVTVNGGNVTGQNFTATAVCSPENWRSWNPLPSLVGVWGTGASDVWVVGRTILHWNGSVWSCVSSGTPQWVAQFGSSGSNE